MILNIGLVKFASGVRFSIYRSIHVVDLLAIIAVVLSDVIRKKEERFNKPAPVFFVLKPLSAGGTEGHWPETNFCSQYFLFLR